MKRRPLYGRRSDERKAKYVIQTSHERRSLQMLMLWLILRLRLMLVLLLLLLLLDVGESQI
jgi:hypothetical protein